MRILHIASDEKFINSAYGLFEAIAPNQNTFYIIEKSDNSENWKHVKKSNNIRGYNNDLTTLKSLNCEFNDDDLLVFHGIDYYKAIILNSLKPSIKVLWIIWGKEFYNNTEIIERKEILGDDTFQEFEKKVGLAKLKFQLKNLFRDIDYLFRNKTLSPNKEIKKGILRANYCGILYKEEYNYIKKHLPIQAAYFRLSYYPIEKMVADINDRVTSNNILLGNSSHATNNHLEAFQALSKLNLEDRNVITPLNYGNLHYKSKIIEHGKSYLQNNFKPLTTFLPLHEYNSYIRECGVVVMNHYRQQAVGNVMTMLWMGAKVYLDQRNTLYHYLKRIGIKIFTVLDDLVPSNYEALNCLSLEDQEKHRKILRNEIGEQELINVMTRQLNDMMQ